MTQTQRLFKLGATTIVTQSDAFADGYSNGFAASPETVSTQQPLTDTMFYEMIVTNILDVHASNEWNAGFIAGTLDGLRTGYTPPPPSECPIIPLGRVTLRLNDWRFREGFFVEQDDLHADRAEQQTGVVLTARDLLSYVAHRNLDTKRYFFDEEQLTCLEDTLGQLIGYLCATLFPSASAKQEKVQVQGTAPVPMAVLQDA